MNEKRAHTSSLHKAFAEVLWFPHIFGFVHVEHIQAKFEFQKSRSRIKRILFPAFLSFMILDNLYTTLYMCFADITYMQTKEQYDILIHTSSRSLGCLLGCILAYNTDELVFFMNAMLYYGHSPPSKYLRNI